MGVSALDVGKGRMFDKVVEEFEHGVFIHGVLVASEWFGEREVGVSCWVLMAFDDF